jgi:uncharacterized Fe-S radical SAM superfamily protein PflX
MLLVVEYRIVKKCGLCRGRFVVSRSQSKRIYCDACQLKVDKSNAEMAVQAEQNT